MENKNLRNFIWAISGILLMAIVVIADTSISNNFISTSGFANVGGDLVVGGDLSLTENANIGGNTNIAGNLDVVQNLNVTGNSFVVGNLEVIGELIANLNITEINLTNVNGNIGVADGFEFQTAGVSALRLNRAGTSIYSNTFVGQEAGTSASGKEKTSVGYLSGKGNTKDGQTSFGFQSGVNNTGFRATSFGYQTGIANSGSNAISIGSFAGNENSGNNQIAIGENAGSLNSVTQSIAIGTNVGKNNSGRTQVAIGAFGGNNNTGEFQVAIGYFAGEKNKGDHNVQIGYFAGDGNNGSKVIAIGFQAGQGNIGSNNIFLGENAGKDNTKSNQFIVGNGAFGSPIIQGDFNTGFVGIGTSQSTVPLTITRQNGQTAMFQLKPTATNPSNWNFGVDFNSGRLVISNNSVDEKFTILQNGNVGIGTSTPQNLLNVLGDINFTGLIYGDGSQLTGISTSVGADSIDGTELADTITLDANMNFAGFNFSVNTNDFFVSINSGNVGIGTNNPTVQLHIKNDAESLTEVRIDNTNSGSDLDHTGLTLYDGNDVMAFLQHNNNQDITSFGNAVGELSIYTSNTEKMRIDGSGNVGIGTTTPSSKLEINGSVNLNNTLYVIESRKVGIRTNDPQYMLDMGVNTYVAIDGLFGHIIQHNSASSQFWTLATRNNGNFDIATSTIDPRPGGNVIASSNAKLTILPSGNVGIGTTSPSTKLDVNGNITGDYFIGDGSLLTGISSGGGSVWDNSTGDALYNIGNVGISSPFYYKYGGANTLKFSNAGTGIFDGIHLGLESGGISGVRQTALGYQAGKGASGDSILAVGYQAGINNTGISQIVMGRKTGQKNTGNYQIAIGEDTGLNNTGSFQLALGFQSALHNTGVQQISIGYISGQFNKGDREIAIGVQSGYLNTGNDSIGIGFSSIFGNSGNNVLALGRRAGENNVDDNQFIVKMKEINNIPLIQGNFSSGFLGIGTTSPGAKLEVNGFTMLGSDAPAIKFKKFTGTMVSGAGQTSFSSGIDTQRVLDVSCRLTKTGVVTYFTGSTSTATAFHIEMNGASVFITPESSNYQNQPYECLITYEK